MEKLIQKAVVWLRNDLRFSDNPALAHAAVVAEKVTLVYIYEGENGGDFSVGGASKWWLHHALVDFQQQVRAQGGELMILKGKPVELIEEVVELAGAEAVYWNRRYEPDAIAVDTEVKAILKQGGVEVKSFRGNVLNEPQEVLNKTGKPYQVFTPYWKNVREITVEESEAYELVLDRPEPRMKVIDLGLLSGFNWWGEMTKHWDPTAAGCKQALNDFKKEVVAYPEQRDTPSIEGTSKLSSYLHFGQLSVRDVFHAYIAKGNGVEAGYLRQLYWRDFAHHLMFHFPHSMRRSLKKEYDQFPWQPNDAMAQKWCEGQTGYPIVDAGMRQLWQTGWMHNRVRMIVGSLLVKHLLQPWQVGLDWFWDTLVDADLANNVMGWQWCGGSGADAAPYFRIFNPVTQGEKFDPAGEYIRHYLPELKDLPNSHIHKPWELTEIELKAYGVELGKDYPAPIVGLKEGREKALAAYQKYRGK